MLKIYGVEQDENFIPPFSSRDLTIKHRRLAEIIEMIHTASLIHDDVLDESDMRRGTSQDL